MNRHRQIPPNLGIYAIYARRQRGIALVVGLVILVILALLGTTAYSVATQEERMAGNARDHARAFEAAEYMLRQCETAVQTLTPLFDATGGSVNGVTGAGMFTAPTTGRWVGDSTDWTIWFHPTIQWPAPAQPKCLAEDFASGAKLNPSTTKALIPHTARVTAVGYGISTGTKVTLVSYVNYFATN